MSTADHSPANADLATRVLGACQDARRPGRAVPAPPAITAVEAFSRATDSLAGVLCALEEHTWHVTVLRGLTVQQLVGHLLGVERDVARALDGVPEVARADHVATTQAAARAQDGRPTSETYRDWRDAVDVTLDRALATSPAAPVALHGVHLPLAQFLIARAFELWAHENDIRAVAGLPASVPDDSTLALMSQLAVGMLPHAIAGQQPDRETGALRLHLVLTGAGGGTWDVDVPAPQTATPDAQPDELMIVAGAAEFCRLVANRLRPDELDAQVSGDAGAARRVLTAATTLALD